MTNTWLPHLFYIQFVQPKLPYNMYIHSDGFHLQSHHTYVRILVHHLTQLYLFYITFSSFHSHFLLYSSRLWVTHLNDPINVIMGYLLQSNLILLNKWDLSLFLLFRHLFSFFLLPRRTYVCMSISGQRKMIFEDEKK